MAKLPLTKYKDNDEQPKPEEKQEALPPWKRPLDTTLYRPPSQQSAQGPVFKPGEPADWDDPRLPDIPRQERPPRPNTPDLNPPTQPPAKPTEV